MSEPKVKGSIVYELLIVVLAAGLIFSILYPKRLADQEEANVELGRSRMEEVQKAELQYQKYNRMYTDTLSVLFDFIETSPQYEHFVDSVVVGGLDSIVTKLNDFKSRQIAIGQEIPTAIDTIMIDSLTNMQNEIKLESRQLAGYVEFIHDRMKSLPNIPLEDLTEAFLVIDSKQFTLDMEIVKNSVEKGNLEDASKASDAAANVIQSVIDKMNLVITKVPSYKDSNSLETLGICPTTLNPFTIVHVDTSAIKYLNIYCPIDSTDVSVVEANFLKSKIGGLSIQNHGKIESGQKSWEEGAL